MNPIATINAVNFGLNQLTRVAKPIANFALQVLQTEPPTTADPEVSTDDPHLTLAQEAQQSLFDLIRQLERHLETMGIELDEPVELQLSATGRVLVANAHPARKSIEDVFARTQLGENFHQLAARFKQLETFPDSQPHRDAPRRFQVRYGTGELHARFVQ